MSQKQKIIIGLIFTVLLIAGVWFRFYQKIGKRDFQVVTQPVVSVNYYQSFDIEKNTDQLEVENNQYIADSATVLSDFKPNLGQFVISSSKGVSNFAEYNLFWTSDITHFSPSITTIDTRNETAKDLSTVFGDPNYQRFAQLNRQQNYDLYLTFEGVTSPSIGVVIGNNVFQARKISDRYFKVTDLRTQSSQFYGIKPVDSGEKIVSAVFITTKIELATSNESRILSSGEWKTSGSQVQVDMPNNSFIVLTSPSRLYLVSDQIGNYHEIAGIFFSGNDWVSNSATPVQLNQSMIFNLLSQNGNYNIIDFSLNQRRDKYITITVFLLILFALLVFWKKFPPIRKILAIVSKFWQRTKAVAKKRQAEMLIYLAVMVLVLISGSTYFFSYYFTIPIFLAIILFLLVVYNRFSIQIITTIILSLLFVIIIFCQTVHVSLQKSLENIIFFFLLVSAITMIVSNFGKKR